MNRLISILVLLMNSGVFVFARPSNDRCIDSITLVESEKVNGDNSNANYDYNNQGVCGPRSDRRAVWYEINGVGKEVTVNVCTNNDKLTDFGIFRSCNSQNCKGFPPQQMVVTDCAADESNQYSFLAKNGESYYIHVRSDVVFEGEGSDFTIWYTEVADDVTSTPETLPYTEEQTESTNATSTSEEQTMSTTSGSESPKTFLNVGISSMIAGFGYGLLSLL